MSDKSNHFNTINRRILWLNDRIAWCQVNDKPFDLYVREREALIWVTDTVKNLSLRLLKVRTPNLDLTPEQELKALRTKVESLEYGIQKLNKDLKTERDKRKKAQSNFRQVKT